jgi:hypothetical protein
VAVLIPLTFFRPKLTKNQGASLIWDKALRPIFNGKMVFAKLIFFPPKLVLLRKISIFQNTKKKFWREKNQLSIKVF